MSRETSLFLTGAAQYVADVDDPKLDGAAHVVFVRSLSAHARIAVDTSAARKAPGVLTAISAKDNPIWPLQAYSPMHPNRFAQPLLAESKVRFVGEPVAVVVAETRAQAVDAAEAVIVDYDELSVVMTVKQAATDQTLLFADTDRCRRHVDGGPDSTSAASNVVRTHASDDISTPARPELFDAADVVVRGHFTSPRQLAVPLECRGAAAAWTADGDLHVWISVQTPHAYRARLAPMYGLALAQVHVIAGPFVGGGFGGKGAAGPEEQLVPYLAQRIGRPVRWSESRSENLTASVHGRAEAFDLALAGSSAGELQAIRVDMQKDAGAYPMSGAGLPGHWSWPMLTGTYDIGHVEFELTTAVTNAAPVGALRGAGRAPIIAALERAVDLFAAEIGMDPAELRRRNLIPPSAMPWTSPTGARYDEADYPGALAQALELVDYDKLKGDQAARRMSGGPLLGIGISSYNHRTCGAGGESALVRIDPDGSATIITGTTSQGQAHEATWRTIASGELGIAPDHITVIEGVTDEISTGVGAIGSRSVQTAGLAIHEAAATVVNQAKSLVADLLEAASVDIVFDRDNGSFHVVGTPIRSIGWAELGAEGEAQDRPLSCDHFYDNGGRDVFPSGCHIAVVEVDPDTGGWTLIRFAAVDDAGVRINQASVVAQLHGGIALGIAQAMGEAATYDDAGNPTAANLMDYPAITIDQVCQFDLAEQVVPSSYNANGYKAVGESGSIGATAAVQNAVIDAVRHLGIDHIDLPCTPQRVWQALNH